MTVLQRTDLTTSQKIQCGGVLSVTLFRRGFLGLFLIDRGSICHIDPSSSES